MESTILVTEETEQIIKQYLPTNAKLAEISNLFSLFSDVTRIKLLSALLISDLCVTDIATVLELNQTTVSHQLKLLKTAKIVESRRYGKIIFYSITKNIESILSVGAEYLGY